MGSKSVTAYLKGNTSLSKVLYSVGDQGTGGDDLEDDSSSSTSTGSADQGNTGDDLGDNDTSTSKDSGDQGTSGDNVKDTTLTATGKLTNTDLKFNLNTVIKNLNKNQDKINKVIEQLNKYFMQANTTFNITVNVKIDGEPVTPEITGKIKVVSSNSVVEKPKEAADDTEEKAKEATGTDTGNKGSGSGSKGSGDQGTNGDNPE